MQHRKTERTFTSWTRCQASIGVSVTVVSSFGLMPALLNRTSTRPSSVARPRVGALTWSSSVTSADDRELALGVLSARSTPRHGRPPPRRLGPISAPIPLAAPVITQTLPSRRPGHQPLRRVVDVLHFGVVVERVRAELAADARLLEAAERRGHPHRGVRVDRDHARVDRAGDAQRPAPSPVQTDPESP